MPALSLIKIITLVGWGVIELTVQGIKAHNLNKQLKLQEKEAGSSNNIEETK